MKFKTTQINKMEKIVIILFSIIFLTLPLLIFLDSIDVEWLEKPTTVGNNIGGILAPILSFGGSILVYIAFKGQIQANQIIQEQFIKQNNDQLFFRLIDTLERKITLFSIVDKNNVTYAGYSFITYSCLETNKRLNSNLIQLGYDAMISKPQLFDASYYEILYNLIRNPTLESSEIFMNNIFESSSKTERETLLQNLNLKPFYTSDLNAFYKDCAKKNFYKFSINAQMKYYRDAFQEYRTYPTFFHSYFTNFLSIIRHINKSNDKESFVTFLVENLTIFEKIIIFLYIATGRAKKELKVFIKKYNVLEEIIEYPTLKIGNPENFSEHIEAFLTFEV